MTRDPLRLTSAVTMALLVLAGLAASAGPASATVQYKVWYFDDNGDWFQEGDVSVSNVKLDPPAWACTIRFYGPSYYRWVDTSENTISSADFNQDVRIHLPRSGCPESEIVIRLLDGTVLVPPHEVDPQLPGSSYIEITTNGAINWLDENGSNHACGFGCATTVGNLTYFTLKVAADVLLDSINGVQSTMLVLPRQSTVPAAVARLRGELRKLDTGVRTQIATRRRQHLGDHEQSVRALEDAAIATLAQAGSTLAQCEQLTREWRFAEAFVSAQAGRQDVETARSLLHTAEFSFRPASR